MQLKDKRNVVTEIQNDCHSLPSATEFQSLLHLGLQEHQIAGRFVLLS